MTIPRFLRAWEAKHPFSEDEAWNIFRVAAVAEAFGWTLLIAGVLVNHYHLPGSTIAIPIAGQVHGTIFLAYFGALIATYSSLRWSRHTAMIAAIAGVPPYGTLVFEQFAARARRKKLRALEHRVIARAIIQRDGALLACQPAENTSWVLPGVLVRADESPQQSLTRKVSSLTGVEPKLGPLRYVAQTQTRGRQQLEMFFDVRNSKAFNDLDLAKLAAASDEDDDIRFVKPNETEALQPNFLQTAALSPEPAVVSFY